MASSTTTVIHGYIKAGVLESRKEDFADSEAGIVSTKKSSMKVRQGADLSSSHSAADRIW